MASIVADIPAVASWYTRVQSQRILWGLSPDPPPAGLWCEFSTSLYNDDGTGGTPVSGGGYARAPIVGWSGPTTTDTFVCGDYSLASRSAFAASNVPGGYYAPSTNPTFPAATSSWGIQAAIGIYDAVSGGTLRWILQYPDTSTFIPNHHPGPRTTLGAVLAGQTVAIDRNILHIGFSNVDYNGQGQSTDVWPLETFPAMWVPVIKHHLGIAAYTPPSYFMGLAVPLHLTNPVGTLTEPTDTSYARIALGGISGPTPTTWPGGVFAGTKVSISGSYSWTIGPLAVASTYQGAVPVIYDASSGGNPVVALQGVTPAPLNIGDVITLSTPFDFWSW